jgi:acyl-coenzyme A synthetase/AMP-(fatty) acid ligase
MDLDQIHPQLSAVFSSGGPLALEDVEVWNRHVPSGVIEVYGSTESGGIAWRNQSADPESDAWNPFPDVHLNKDEDGALRLRCNRVPFSELRLEDAVDFLPDGRFRLMGRLDRVVKLQEKRVSLPEMEALLREHPWVRQAALVVLDERPRRVLGAALVIHPHADVSRDRKVLIDTFRTHLARRFEPVVIPKRWRFPDELPFNERGKLEAEVLSALFDPRGSR